MTTSARDVIALGFDGPNAVANADSVIESLAFAGYRVIGPGELDAVTVERCARVVDLHASQMEAEKTTLMPSGLRAIADALRTLIPGQEADDGE